MLRLKRKNTNTKSWWEKYYSFQVDDKTPSRERSLKQYEFVTGIIYNGTVLDIGCGFGEGSNLIKSKTKAKVTGVDIAESAIKAAKESYSDIEFKVSDVVEEDFDEFDWILLIEILEHLEDPFKLVEKALSKARNGVIISFPNRPDKTDPEYTHINIFDVSDFNNKFHGVRFIGADKCIKLVIYKSIEDTIPGWLHEEEAYFLEMLAKLAPEGEAYEIGSYKGKSAVHIGKVRPVFCVDNFSTGAFDLEKRGLMEGEFLEEFKKNVGDLPCIPIKSDHRKFVDEYNGLASFVFVDGSHFFENALFDIDSWFKRLVNNGIIAVHDSGHEEVAHAIKVFVDRRKPFYIGQVRSIKAFKRVAK